VIACDIDGGHSSVQVGANGKRQGRQAIQHDVRGAGHNIRCKRARWTRAWCRQKLLTRSRTTCSEPRMMCPVCPLELLALEESVQSAHGAAAEHHAPTSHLQLGAYSWYEFDKEKGGAPASTMDQGAGKRRPATL
jgi:hypothetical protein